MMATTVLLILILAFSAHVSAANVFTAAAIFERLSHFKDAGVVNHLNTVDQAMIADGSCRMVRPDGHQDGYSLWHDAAATGNVIAALKEALPPTSKPSHFVLSAHDVLKDVCPPPLVDDVEERQDYSCRGGGHGVEDMVAAMHNWHRALCAAETEPEWQGEYDPAYQPQQVALTAGFMCILACDCNGARVPASSLSSFAESPESADAVRYQLCSSVPWEEVDFLVASRDVARLAQMA